MPPCIGYIYMNIGHCNPIPTNRLTQTPQISEATSPIKSPSEDLLFVNIFKSDMSDLTSSVNDAQMDKEDPIHPRAVRLTYFIKAVINTHHVYLYSHACIQCSDLSYLAPLETWIFSVHTFDQHTSKTGASFASRVGLQSLKQKRDA